jgi:hypothetical protein
MHHCRIPILCCLALNYACNGPCISPPAPVTEAVCTHSLLTRRLAKQPAPDEKPLPAWYDISSHFWGNQEGEGGVEDERYVGAAWTDWEGGTTPRFQDGEIAL